MLCVVCFGSATPFLWHILRHYYYIFFVNVSFAFNCVSVLTAFITEKISLGSSDRFNFDRFNCFNS